MFMLGKLLRFGSIVAWIFHIIACMGCFGWFYVARKCTLTEPIECHLLQSSGCLGIATKTKLDSTVDEPLQQQEPQAQIPSKKSKASISESFWSNSNCDMDVSAVQSQGSVSSVSSLLTDTRGAGSSNASSEFVNHGLILWNQTRRQWIGSRKPVNQVQQLREPKLSWNATYDSLLGSNKPFPKPIPLAEMVDFLVDIWEQEGMYD